LAPSDVELERLRTRVDLDGQRIDLLRASIEAYKDQTYTGLTILAVLLAVVGLLLPIFTYLTSVLPGNKVVDEARKAVAGLDQRFTELSEKYRDKLVEEAIQQLRVDDQGACQSALTHLALNAHYPFAERQLFDLCDIARVSTDASMRMQLLSVVARHDSRYVDTLLKEELQRPERALQSLLYVAMACAQPNRATMRAAVGEWLVAGPDVGKHLPTVISFAANFAPILLKELVSDESLMRKISAGYRILALGTLKLSASARPEAAAALAGSALVDSLKGELPIFMKSNMTTEETDPDAAVWVMRYVDGVLKESIHSSMPAFKEALAHWRTSSSKAADA
jgi:hypothetical protein